MTASVPSVGFRDIKQAILQRIRDRTWPLGGQIPAESDLAEQFNCARATVNRALRELAEAGILERKRRAGTRVVRDPVRQARIDIPVIRLEVEATGAKYRYARLSRTETPAPDWLHVRFGLDRPEPMVHIRSLHLADNRPYQFEDRWINLAAVPDAAGEPFEAISANEWLVRQVPYSDGQISFSAETASAEAAQLLGIAPGEAVFAAERMTWLDGRPITLARMLHPAAYRLTTRF